MHAASPSHHPPHTTLRTLILHLLYVHLEPPPARSSSSIYNLNVQKSLSFIERTSIEPGLKIGQGRRSIIWDEVEPSKVGACSP